MEEKNTSQLDEVSERHRKITEERKSRRKRILKGVGLGIGVAIGIAGCNYIVYLMSNFAGPMIAGGAMGQWEEVPMPPEDSIVKFNKVYGRMGIG